MAQNRLVDELSGSAPEIRTKNPKKFCLGAVPSDPTNTRCSQCATPVT